MLLLRKVPQHITYRRLFGICLACGKELDIPSFTERNRKVIDKMKRLSKDCEAC